MKPQPFTGLLKLTVIAGEVTVTVAVQLLTLPFTSVTVKVTVLGPWLLQENEFGFTERLAIPQASLLPPSICEAVIETDPLLGALTVMLWQTAKGATLSTTVTVAEQLLLLPWISVTVNTTVLTFPTLAQPKLLLSSERLAMPQLSLLPLFTSAVVMLPAPLASS